MLRCENIASIGDEVAFAWSDGLETYVKLEDLRRACPCAKCQGEPDVTGKIISLGDVVYNEHSFKLVRWENIGGYAYQFWWADGHSTGIYSYEYLRKLER